MAGLLARRLSRVVISAFVVVIATFAMLHAIPGDPVRVALGPEAPQSLVDAKRTELGLDRPLHEQFFDYLGHLMTGDLGTSMVSGFEVAKQLADQAPSTLLLAALASIIALVCGVAIGFGAAVSGATRRRGKSGNGFILVTGAMSAIPEFLIAIGLVFVFAILLPIFPIRGSGGPSSLILPVLALAIAPTALLARTARVEGERVLASEYMRTARAKRLRPSALYLRHALPNALTAVMTNSGLIFASLLAGTVLVETVFARAGLGRLLVSSILAKDYPVVQAIALYFGLAVLLVTLVIDVLITTFDRTSTLRSR